MTYLPASRLGALLAVGALAVHELRYRLAFGGAAEETLHAHGHGYLAVAGLLVAVVAALILGRGVALWAGGRSAPVDVGWRIGRLWPALALALAAIFSVQELLEGLLAGGHPSGIGAVTAGGGWIGFVAAGAVAHGLALSLRLAAWAGNPLRAPRSALSPDVGWTAGRRRPVSPPCAVHSPASARGPPLPA